MESPRPSDQPTEAIILRCACYGLPFARLEGDKLVIESRHKGEVHVNEISVGALGALGGQRSHARVAAYADS